MSFNKSPLAFDDLREIFNRALNAKSGIRIACRSRGDAIVLRTRFNYFRKLDRADNKRLYQMDDYMHGRSAYDRLVLTVPARGAEDENYLYIKRRRAEDLTVEELGEEGTEDGTSDEDVPIEIVTKAAKM